MQTHQIKTNKRKIKSKRVGRGGKKGTYSGRGSKGQKSRAGTRIRPGFRGGNEPLWKLFPKKRGSSKKIDVRKRLFSVKYGKPSILNLSTLEKYYENGDTVSIQNLLEKGLIKNADHGVKILGNGELKKKLKFEKGIKFSKKVNGQIS